MSAIQGFAAVPTWMLRDKSIRRTALLVYASLSSRSGLGAIHPSQATIAEEAGVSERTVRSVLGELVELGVVVRVARRGSEGRATGLSDAYVLHPNGRLEGSANSAGRFKGPEEGTGKSAHSPLYEVENSEVSARRPRSKGAVALPASWVPTPEHRARAAAAGVDLDREVEAFRLHAKATGRRLVNWNAGFHQWLLRARPAVAAAASEGVLAGWRPGDEWMGLSR